MKVKRLKKTKMKNHYQTKIKKKLMKLLLLQILHLQNQKITRISPLNSLQTRIITNHKISQVLNKSKTGLIKRIVRKKEKEIEIVTEIEIENMIENATVIVTEIATAPATVIETVTTTVIATETTVATDQDQVIAETEEDQEADQKTEEEEIERDDWAFI